MPIARRRFASRMLAATAATAASALIAATAFAAMMLSAPSVASAQATWPTRPITLVIPYAPGGPADTLARALAQRLEPMLGQTIVVESKAGGAATIGTGHVAHAKPDGYTLLLSTSAGHVVTPLMQRVNYDGIDDFSFIAILVNQPNVLVVHPKLGVDRLDQLVALAKAEPGKLNYASAGAGGATHLGAEMFLQRAKIGITHVPYAGAAPALRDLLGGHVGMGMLNLAATRAHIADGRLKALAYSGSTRSALLPQVPTLAEAGIKGAESSTWYSLAAPRGTPAAIIDRLSEAIRKINADDGWQKFLAPQGGERMSMSPQEATEYVKRDKETMKALLGSLNLLGKS